jgi:hypothetical protein
MSLQPLSRLKPRSALSIPAATPRFTIVPSRQRFTFLVVVRRTEVIDSMGLVDVNVLA